MDEVVLARHGESEYSAVGRVNGDPSIPVGLTAPGREEARRLGLALAGEEIDLCVTSSFRRTRETADLALRALGARGRAVPREAWPDLDDIRPGDFEGGSLEAYRTWAREAGPRARPPGAGESRVVATARYVRAFRALLARRERRILVVAHGLPVTYAVLAADGRGLPLSLAGVQVEHAAAHRLTADRLASAIERMEAFVAAPRSPVTADPA